MCHPLENADVFLLKCKFENVLPIDQMLNGKPWSMNAVELKIYQNSGNDIKGRSISRSMKY